MWTPQDRMCMMNKRLKFKPADSTSRAFSMTPEILNLQHTKISSRKITKIQIPEFPTMGILILRVLDKTQESSLKKILIQGDFDVSEPWTTFWAVLSGPRQMPQSMVAQALLQELAVLIISISACEKILELKILL